MHDKRYRRARWHGIEPEEHDMRQTRHFRPCIGIALILFGGGASADGSGQWQSGQEAYNKVCGFCHERGIGPVIKGTRKSPDLIRMVVRSGNRAMPAFRQSEIDDATLAKIAEYIQ
jgi:4-cresol dehydrogenase (hydroxylating) cytochrome subunit